jgi:hypothetical protein
VPSGDIHQRQLYGDQSDSFYDVYDFSSYILNIKKPNHGECSGRWVVAGNFIIGLTIYPLFIHTE